MSRHITYSRIFSAINLILMWVAMLVVSVPVPPHQSPLAGKKQTSRDPAAQTHQSSSEPTMMDCQGVGTSIDELPMWSWGFSSRCCDVFPSRIVNGMGNFFEHGDPTSASYFPLHPVRHGDVVYVVTSDIPAFLQIFMRLPQSSRIVLVTGSEDIGAPFELFHVNRPNFFSYNMRDMWHSPKAPVDIRSFLADTRLVHWFMQNYDATGCNHFTCSTLSSNISSDKALLKKLTPIPIGFDLHSFAGKGAIDLSMLHNASLNSGSHQNSDSHKSPDRIIPPALCEQWQDISAVSLLGSTLPFSQRLPVLVASFDCHFRENTKTGAIRKKTRGQLCALMRSLEHLRREESKRVNMKERGNGLSLPPVSVGVNSSTVALPVIVSSLEVSSDAAHMTMVDKSATERIMRLSLTETVSQLEQVKVSESEAKMAFVKSHLTKMLHARAQKDSLNLNNKLEQPESSPQDKRSTFWMLLSRAQFSIAPAGFGMDTHRVWEVLQFGCVPIVLTSPLDILYAQFPVVILRNWTELFVDGALEKFRDDIIRRFGESWQDAVRAKLQISHWKAEVLKMKKQAMMLP